MTLNRRHLVLTPLALALAGAAARAQSSGGPLRIVWLQGNPVQARVSPDGKAQGPAIDMAEALAARLGRPLDVTGVTGTDAVLQRVRIGAADAAFIGFDPSRARGLAFTAPYLMSLNSYAVRNGSPIVSADQVDRYGIRIGAILTDTGGLYLRRSIRDAILVSVSSTEQGVQQLKTGAIGVLAGAGQRLIDLSVSDGGFRMLPGHFFEVPQTIAVREDQRELLAAASATVEQALASGAVAASIKRWNLPGAGVPSSTMKTAEAARSLAPSGVLRVAINAGNGVLTQRNAQGDLTGVSVILARALAERLKLPITLIPFQAAGEIFSVMDKDIWDLAFLAIEPERAAKIEFSPPYITIDGTYLVRRDAPFRNASDLDQPGVRIAVGRGAAYDLFLTRTLKRAELRRATTAATSIDMFISDGLEAAAGVRQYLVERARGIPDLRVLEDRFTNIEQAMGVPKGRQAGAAYVAAFIEEMKASGAVRKALDATGQGSAIVAPAVNRR